LLPTILDLAGLPLPPDLPGTSVADWCTQGTGTRQGSVLLGLGRWRAIYDGVFFYAVEAKDGTAAAIRLTDTANDPWDADNLVDDPRFREAREHLHADLINRLTVEKDFAFLDAAGMRHGERW
jgi:arylsulfatase A-like enzyme